MTNERPGGAAIDPLLDQAPCGFLSFDAHGTITLVNATLADWLGVPAASLQGQPLNTMLTRACAIFFQTHVIPMTTLHGATQELFLTLRARDSEELSVFANLVRRERGGQVTTDAVLMRFRERQRYEAELLRMKQAAESARREAEDASRAKSAFLAMLSHELRTPLNAIAGYTQLLALGVRGAVTEAQQTDLTRMQNSQRHLLAIINDVLTFAKSDSGSIDYDRIAVPLVPLLRGAEELTAPLFTTKGIAFALEASPLVVVADPDRVSQILLNLLSNAAKFTDRGGRVTMRAEAVSADEARIVVTDTGCGMPPDRIESAFAPFTQLDRRLNHPVEGVGLGLAIARDFARAMGGDLTATSEPGVGSSFALTLPRSG